MPATILWAGNSAPTTASVTFPPLRVGINNTGIVGDSAAIYGVDIAFASDEMQANQDLNGSGVGFLFGQVIRVVDIDAHILYNTRILGNYPTITAIPNGGVWIAFIATEQFMGNLSFPNGDATPTVTPPGPQTGWDVNNDGDTLDFPVVLQAYRGLPPGVAPGDTWVIAPPQSPGFSFSGFASVHMSTRIMVLQPGLLGQVTFPPPVAPFLVADLIGFSNVVAGCGPSPPSPNPFPTFVQGAPGISPVVSYRETGPPTFPTAGFIVFTRSEQDLGGDSNGDGDQCDRMVYYQSINGQNTAGLGCLQISRTLGPPCNLGVIGNDPDAYPDPTYGQHVLFDVLGGSLQPGVGPDCLAPLPDSPVSERATILPLGFGTGCTVGPSTQTSVPAQRLTVSGKLLAFTVNENFPGVGDLNVDGSFDPSLVLYADQNSWPPSPRWRVIGPGWNPDAEGSFQFQVQTLPPGVALGLVAYHGDETFASTLDLNLDGDQNDMVILFSLQ